MLTHKFLLFVPSQILTIIHSATPPVHIDRGFVLQRVPVRWIVIQRIDHVHRVDLLGERTKEIEQHLRERLLFQDHVSH